MKNFDRKVALVTGGRTGIGRATARILAEQGATVAIGVRKDGDGVDTLDEVEAAGGKGILVKIDIADESQIDDGIASIIDKFGRLDVLVTNAGIEQPDTVVIGDIKRSDMQRIFDINLRGTWLCCQAAMPHLHSSKGSICLVSSLWGTLGGAGLSAYSATKGGVHAMTRALAVENGPADVRVNCVAPGAIKTPMLDRVMAGGFPFDVEANIPLQKLGEADEVADAIVWVCSPGARYVTGQVIGVDGGITIKMSTCG
jgi:NAD(P)-dependent dehydrogenase (short-subunit alcohol dehydrogenase family)